MRSHDVLCHSVIERVILSASDSLDHCTQVVKFKEDYVLSMAWTLHEFSYLIFLVYIY